MFVPYIFAVSLDKIVAQFIFSVFFTLIFQDIIDVDVLLILKNDCLLKKGCFV